MNAIGQILVYLGATALVLSWVGFALCGFAVSFWRGLLALVVPFVAFGTAFRRFPWLIGLWGGGIALVLLGSLLS